MSRRHRKNPHALPFLAIAILLVIAIDLLVFGDKPPVTREQAQREARVVSLVAEKPVFETEIAPPPAQQVAAVMAPPAAFKKTPAWQNYAVAVDLPANKPRITIIIDDLGADRIHTREVIELMAPLTLAFLPYPAGVKALVEEGRRAGHEIMMHMPMEAVEADLDSGSYVLRTGMDAASFEKILLDNLGKFDGYVGINNHMGSALTQDAEALRLVMAHLYEAGFLFIDSRTIASSIAEQVAADYGVPHAARDVFLDNDPTREAVQAQLAEVERVAREKGRAIAIGHPKEGTIAALRAWLPTLAGKGFVLVPVSAAVAVR